MAPLAPIVGTVEPAVEQRLRVRGDHPGKRGRTSRKRGLPIESSTLLPKIHRKSMLKAMCRKPPCRNIDVNTVAHHGGESSGRESGQALGLPVVGGALADHLERGLGRGRLTRDLTDRAVLARMRQAVRDRPVLERGLVPLGHARDVRRGARPGVGGLRQLPHEHRDVEHDESDGHHGEPQRRDVVLDWDQGARSLRVPVASSTLSRAPRNEFRGETDTRQRGST